MRYSFVVINTLMVLTLLAWPFLAFGSFFMIDAPGASDNPLTWGLIFTSLYYPVPVVVGVIGSILCWKFKQPLFTRLFTYISVSPLVVYVFLWIGMYVFCSGNFACR